MTKTKPLELLREAMAALRAQDKPRTRQLLQEATRLDPKIETAWQWLAGVAETPREAMHALERVLALNPSNDKARAALRPIRLQVGIEAAKAKDAPTARHLLRVAVAEDPASEMGWLWLASVAESPQEALSHLNRVLALNPTNATAHKGIAYYKTKLKSLDETPPPRAEIKPGNKISSTTPVLTQTARVPPPPPRAMPAPPKPRLVLVVDDSRTIRKLVSMTMASVGFRVLEAEDGNEATHRIRDDGIPDLILLDIAMPGMDGYEFCRLIRSNPDTKHVPVIMLTGKDGFFDKIRGRLAGTSGYLVKPLQPQKLLATVEKLLPTTANA